MATVNHKTDGPVSTAHMVTWTAIATGDTIVEYAIPEEYGVVGCSQITGTFGGATVAIQVSNDATTWFNLVDLQGVEISATANDFADFTTAAVYIRPAISGGTSDDVDVCLSFRGWRG